MGQVSYMRMLECCMPGSDPGINAYRDRAKAGGGIACMLLPLRISRVRWLPPQKQQMRGCQAPAPMHAWTLPSHSLLHPDKGNDLKPAAACSLSRMWKHMSATILPA